MKLEYVYISEFKNLNEFALEFDQSSSGLVTVLLGRNGCGKSNLLEAIVVIFRDLFLGQTTAFGYELRYTINDGQTRVHIDNKQDKIGRFRFNFFVKDDGNEFTISRSSLKKSDGQKFLPRHVFAYYSGPSNRLEEHFREHQWKFYQDLLSGHSQPFRPLFYARPVHSQFVLLSFFTSEDEKPRKFLEEHLGIVALESVLFVMKKPPWDDSGQGDPRFWGARGVVAQFLDRLFKHSLAPMKLSGRTSERGVKRPRKQEYLYLYVPDQSSLLKLSPTAKRAAEFFKELESTYISELIQEVRIRVKVRGYDGSLTFRELSEGEQQLLTVVGLLRFTKERESILLLDEPDTHLNPAWGMQYLETLKEIAEPDSDSQVIMATHDPLVLTGLENNTVIIMERNESNGQVEARYSATGPQGLGLSGILRSPMFGLRTTLDRVTQSKLDRRFELVAKSDKNNEEELELARISSELASAGFAHEFRDSNFDLFAKALGKVHHANQITLSKVEIDELTSEAEKIASDIIRKKD